MQRHQALGRLFAYEKGQIRTVLPSGCEFEPAGAEAFAILRDVLFPLFALLVQEVRVEQLAAELHRSFRAVHKQEPTSMRVSCLTLPAR